MGNEFWKSTIRSTVKAKRFSNLVVVEIRGIGGVRDFFGAPSAENFSDFGAPSGHFGAPKWPKMGQKFFAAPSAPRNTPNNPLFLLFIAFLSHSLTKKSFLKFSIFEIFQKSWSFLKVLKIHSFCLKKGSKTMLELQFWSNLVFFQKNRRLRRRFWSSIGPNFPIFWSSIGPYPPFGVSLLVMTPIKTFMGSDWKTKVKFYKQSL